MTAEHDTAPRQRARLSLALCLGLLAASMPASAAADAADDFLKSIEGKWRGRGTAIIPGRSGAERIVCQVTNSYSAETRQLRVNGECASTQGKTIVSGKLTHAGSSISGSLINAFKGATVTKSSGSMIGENMEVSSSFVDNSTGNLTRTRQVFRKSPAGFTAEFFTFDNVSGAFKPAGTIAFSTN